MPTPWSWIVGSALLPADREARYTANEIGTNELPSLGQLLTAYARGFLTWAYLRDVVRYLGVALPESPDAAVVGTGQLWEVYKTAWQAVVRSQQLRLSEDQLATGLLRGDGGMTPRDYVHGLRDLGWRNRDAKRVLLDQLRTFPTPAQLAMWDARDVLDESRVLRYGYHLGQPDWWRRATGAAGLRWGLEPGFLKTPAGTDLQPADCEWYVHWGLPDFSQALQMRRRLRPSIRDATVSAHPSGLILSPDDWDHWWRASQTAPYWRPFIEAVSQPVIPRRQLRALYQSGQIDSTELQERFRDYGYSPADAQLLADAEANALALARRDRHAATIERAILDAYRTGTASRDQAAAQLHGLWIRDRYALQAWQATPPAGQLVVARADLDVQLTLDIQDQELNTALVRAGVKRVRADFRAAHITVAQAQLQLTSLGVSLPRRQYLLNLWAVEAPVSRQELRTAGVLRLFREGLISPGTLDARLANLGWAAPDRQLLEAEAARQVGLDRAKLAAATARGQAAQRAAALAKAKAQRQATRQAQADLARHGSPQQLARWLCRGLITPADYYTRMVGLGWPKDDAQRLAEAACPAHAAVASKGLQKAVAGTPPRPAKVTRSMLVSWWKKSIITEHDLRTRLAGLGYAAGDVDDIVAAAGNGKAVSSGS